MAEEAVIFPSQPLYMVDRSWQRRGRKLSPSKDLDNSSRVPEITITVLNKPHEGKQVPRQHQSGQEFTDVQFFNYQPEVKGTERASKKGKSSSERKRRTTPFESKYLAVSGPRHVHRVRNPPRQLPAFSRPVTKSTLSLYPFIDPEVIDFGKFLAYYPSRLAESIFPMSKYLNFKFNTIEKIWLPAAVTDEVLLHAVLFASALHYHHVSEQHDFKDAHLLMNVILTRLNRRLHTKTLPDATIGAVSCLAMCENTLGNYDNFRMHMSGMAEMIRTRGGISEIRRELQMKIYRADISGAVDALASLHLPPPVKTSSSLYETLGLNTMHISPLQVILASSGVGADATCLLGKLADLSFAVEHAINSQILVDPLSFEEDLICLQHDLLTGLNWSGQHLDNACRLAALVYLQALSRPIPFRKCLSRALSLELENSIMNTDLTRVSCPLMLWLLVMGGLVSSETPEKQWFRTQLRNCQVSWKDKITWESVKVQLMSVVWIGTIYDEYGRALWEDVISKIQV